METKTFIAIGEEATRGTKESTTVGYIPVNSFKLPKPDYMSKKREEFRGEDTLLGPTNETRMGEKWDGLSLEMPGFSEGGTVKGVVGTIFKHFFGKAVTAQNGVTGQYAHMFYKVSDPYDAANLGAKALTANMNAMHGATLKNHPYVGGRIGKLGFKQETGKELIITADAFGQKLAAPEAGLSNPVLPAENLRFDFNNLKVRIGAAVTRTGTAPNYTNITSSGSSTQVAPDSISLELEDGKADKMVLNGTTSPGKTNIGAIKGKLSMTLDFEDPSSGFSSVDDFTTWLAGVSSTNIHLTWDSGTAAGTGLNHQLIIDLPICNRLGGMPEIKRDGDPTITLEYDLHYDPTTTLYSCGLLLMNTATAV